MRKLLIALCLAALPLSGCAALQTGTLPTPASVAQLTKADEQVAVTAELGYKAFRITVETGVRAGFIKGTRAEVLGDIDNKLYLALQTVEQAYAAGNATQFNVALDDFNNLLKTANSNLGGK